MGAPGRPWRILPCGAPDAVCRLFRPVGLILPSLRLVVRDFFAYFVCVNIKKNCKMKKYRLPAWALLAGAGLWALPAQADDYAYLTLKYGGVEESVALASVKKITFEGTNLQLVTQTGTSEYALSTMQKLFFSATPTALQTVTGKETNGLAYDAAACRLTVGAAAGATRLTVYAVNGTPVRQLMVPAGGTELSLSGLPRGLYVARAGGQTLKFVR